MDDLLAFVGEPLYGVRHSLRINAMQCNAVFGGQCNGFDVNACSKLPRSLYLLNFV